MKLILIAVSLLAAIAGWMIFPPPKTAATQKQKYVPEDYISKEITIIDNAITRPIGTNSATRSEQTQPTSRPSTVQPPFTGRHYSKEEVIQLIKDYSAQYGISAHLPLRIAQCESGYNQFAKNRNSTASGVFQYLSSTWKATDQGKLGLSVFDADANVKAAISYIASRGHARPWAASQSCWSNN